MSDSGKILVVRADANRQMGIGHAMRCLAVAECLVARSYTVVFAMHQVPDALLARLAKAKVEVFRITDKDNSPEGFKRIVEELGGNYILIDGYLFSNDYERVFSGTNVRRLRFDDFMPGKACDADVVVNASPHAQKAPYTAWAPNAALLLGPQHIAFRSEMIAGYKALQAKNAQADNANNPNGNASILINFGGSDHLDMTIRTASAIAELLPDAKIEAVTGAAYPNPERLANLGIKNLIHHHNSDNLPEIMQRARMAISAGGLTVAELALFRIPTILAITAQNQVKGAHVSWCHTILPAVDNGDIDTAEMLDKILIETERLWHLPDERAEITNRIPKLLDVHGAERIADALTGD